MSKHDVGFYGKAVTVDSSMVRTSKFTSRISIEPFRPVLMTTFGGIAFLAWAWLNLSTIDYRRDMAGSGLQTAGWFVLGLPFIIGFGLLCIMPFTFLARNGQGLLAWFAVVTIALSSIIYAHSRSSPASRLSRALEIELPASTTIEALREFDSFNDGTTTFGQITATRDFIDLLVRRHSLTKVIRPSNDLRLRANDSIPQKALCYDGGRLAICYDSDSSLLYFVRRFP